MKEVLNVNKPSRFFHHFFFCTYKKLNITYFGAFFPFPHEIHWFIIVINFDDFFVAFSLIADNGIIISISTEFLLHLAIGAFGAIHFFARFANSATRFTNVFNFGAKH